ncbi:MAG: HypC/HybG/HupF family hydrogenase formation chaperone [Geodermatophilaceae bacterium]
MSGPAGPGAPRAAVPAAPRAIVPACHDEVCITCSDQAIPVRILQVLADDIALVDTGQSEEHVSIALVTADVGDTVLVHAKEAIAVVPSA